MDTQEKINANAYIDIDSIFDTRLPLIYSLDEQATVELMQTKKYHSRVKDNFKDIPYSVFNPLYKNRQKNILKYAMLTPAILFVREHISECVLDIAKSDYVKPILYVNMYPYELNILERNNITYVINKILPNIKIEYVYMSNKELTVNWLSDNVRVMIKYDGVDWLENKITDNTIINKPLLEIVLVAPALANGVVLSKDINITTFRNMMTAGNVFISLMLVNADQFSAIIK